MVNLSEMVMKIQRMLDLMLLEQVLFQCENTIDEILFLFFFVNFSEMAGQANMLVDRMINSLGATEFNTAWKLVTFFIGGNDLCDVCNDPV
jgi:hypothetical protein